MSSDGFSVIFSELLPLTVPESIQYGSWAFPNIEVESYPPQLEFHDCPRQVLSGVFPLSHPATSTSAKRPPGRRIEPLTVLRRVMAPMVHQTADTITVSSNIYTCGPAHLFLSQSNMIHDTIHQHPAFEVRPMLTRDDWLRLVSPFGAPALIVRNVHGQCRSF